MEAGLINNNKKFKLKLYYPIASLALMLLFVVYSLLLVNADLQQHIPLPKEVFNPKYYGYLIAAILVIFWFEYRYFYKRKKQIQAKLNHLWLGKQQLQQRAQLSASHTDKLKLFISDKLLEYIEYDEKYLHFKSIAAEVRHNGVISFDKVQSALLESSKNNSSNTGASHNQSLDALAAMRYLWDLLDLSTTDNMAIHIGNHISHCEELLFQAELQESSVDDLPIQPYFIPQKALLDTLTNHLELQLLEEDQTKVINLDKVNYPLRLNDKEQLFDITINHSDRLLGNANHFILLLENLLKNARFFATKKQYKSAFNPIRIQQWESEQCLNIKLYNRGPHILEEAAQVFQLGFTTRRTKGHHGKGLGLYFAQQIVQGFDGDISFTNIDNQDDDYYLRIELANKEVQHLHILQRCEEGMPLIKLIESDDYANEISLQEDSNIVAVELSTAAHTKVQQHSFKETKQWFVNIEGYPRLLIQQDTKNKNKLTIKPLNISGVEFNIRLPTASGRLAGESAAVLNAPDVQGLQDKFLNPDDF